MARLCLLWLWLMNFKLNSIPLELCWKCYGKHKTGKRFMEIECHTFYRSTKKIIEHKGNRGKKTYLKLCKWNASLSRECFCNCSCFQSFLTRERDRDLWKGKCFPFFIQRKTLSFDKTVFFCLLELSFHWLFFSNVAKHGKVRKMNSKNLFFLKQTRR
jgi:hypothetical protein